MRRLLSLAAILAAVPVYAGPPEADPGTEPDLSSREPSVVVSMSAARRDLALPKREQGLSRYPALPPEPAFPSRFNPQQPASGMDLVTAGIPAGLVGAFVGGGASFLFLLARDSDGFKIAREWPGDDASYGGAVLGWTVGSSLGMHLANRGEGNLPLTLISSLVFATASIALTSEADLKGLYLPLAVVQFGIGMAIEQGTRGSGTR